MPNSGTLLGPFAIRYEMKPSMLLESVLIQNFGLLIRYTTLQCYALLPALLSPKLTKLYIHLGPTYHHFNYYTCR